MAFVWNPEPSEPLFEGLETTTNLTLQVGVSADATDASATPPKITGWLLSGSDSLVDKAQSTVSEAELILFFKDLEGAIPIIGIEYCYPNSTTIYRINNWEDLPNEPIQVTSYRKSPDSPKTLTLSVTALADSGNSETVEYSIIVQGEYSAGRDKLIAALADNA